VSSTHPTCKDMGRTRRTRLGKFAFFHASAPIKNTWAFRPRPPPNLCFVHHRPPRQCQLSRPTSTQSTARQANKPRPTNQRHQTKPSTKKPMGAHPSHPGAGSKGQDKRRST
jgi:hypothetical protein